jgi:hypothetical protein
MKMAAGLVVRNEEFGLLFCLPAERVCHRWRRLNFEVLIRLPNPRMISVRKQEFPLQIDENFGELNVIFKLEFELITSVARIHNVRWVEIEESLWRIVVFYQEV